MHNMKHIIAYVHCICHIFDSCKKSSPNPLAVQQSSQLILTVMAYPLAAVRQQVYTDILTIVKVRLLYSSWSF